jgi:tRNA A-37 threonylcarbamoyl transferase component Bud32/tetratricopeptide (TPR) repeat protein
VAEPDRPARSESAARLGRYRIIERIGQGATAAVYRAHDEQSDREIALKLLLTDLEGEEQVRSRFLREVEIARLLRHRNLVTVYDAGEIDGRFFLAMELLSGVTLREHLTLKPGLGLEDKLDLMMQLCEGLAVAHDHDICHRDLKPSNLFVRDDGALKILDFGIARLASSSMTVAGLLMGTPDFMSPEQARGGEIDHRSDIFSAGAVLYYVLSGRKPFPGAQLPNVLHKVEHEEPVPLADEEAPPMLTRIVGKALAKSPAARYPHVRALLGDLIQCRRQYAESARALTDRARAQQTEAREIGGRCRTLGRVLALPDVDLPSDDVLAFTGLAARHPELAERGDAILGWAPVRHALAADLAAVMTRAVHDRRVLAQRLTDAAETVRLAEEAASAGDQARAIELAERALSEWPTAEAARTIVGRARQALSAQDAVVRQRRAADAIAHARRAIAHSDWASADGHLVRARELDPTNVDLAGVVEELRARRTADEETRRAHERQHRDEMAALVASARTALKAGDFHAAARAAASALAREPGHEEATRVAAEAAAAQTAAASQAERTAKLTSAIARARLLMDASRFDEAREAARHALALDADSEEASALLAAATRAAADARRTREAAAIATRAGQAGRCFLAYAQRALLLGDLEQARGLAETALAIDPTSRSAKTALARAAEALDELGDQGPPVAGDPDATLVLPLATAWTRLGIPLEPLPPRRVAAAEDGGRGDARAGNAALEHRLRIVRVSGSSRELPLANRSYRVGRAVENEIVLEDPSHVVSRVHAELQPARGGYVLIDRDSDHGVWVDGSRVERVTLEPGVPVVIGPYQLVIESREMRRGAGTTSGSVRR